LGQAIRSGFQAVARYGAALAGRAVRTLPGVAGVACFTSGVYVLAGLGWFLLVVGAFGVLVDWRTR
jgi:hypothetical protein